jgi:hypothetical protein
MRFAPLPIPDEVIEIHRPLGLFDSFRATVYFKAPKGFESLRSNTNRRGFISQNEESFAFTTLSTLMDLGIYGMNRVIRKVSRGAKVDNAIESVIYSNGCGEFEIPHISSVCFFPFDAVSNVTCHEDSASNSEIELAWQESSVIIFRVYKLNFKFDGKEFSIVSPDSHMVSLLENLRSFRLNS